MAEISNYPVSLLKRSVKSSCVRGVNVITAACTEATDDTDTQEGKQSHLPIHARTHK